MQKRESRDNDRVMNQDLAHRIRQRLDATGQTANEASRRAGLDRDYIGDLFKTYEKGDLRSPRMDTLAKLAKALRCDPLWLASGRGTPDGASGQNHWSVMLDELSTEDRTIVYDVIRGLHAKTKAPKAS